MISTDDFQHLLGSGGTVVGEGGEKIGRVGQLFLDARSGEPEWVTVTTGLFGRAESFVPLADARVQGDEVVVPYDKATVKGAPRVEDADGHLSPEEERELYRYYGFGDDADAGDDDADAGDDDATDDDVRHDDARNDVTAGGEVRHDYATDDDVRHDDAPGTPRAAVVSGRDGTATGGRHAAANPVDAPGSVDATAARARAATERPATGAGTPAPTGSTAVDPTGTRVAAGSTAAGGARLRRYVGTDRRTTAEPVPHGEAQREPAPGAGGAAGAPTDGR